MWQHIYHTQFCINFHAVTCTQKSALFKSIFQAQLLLYCSQSVTVHSHIYSPSALTFFSGIDSTLLEIFKNLWDLLKKWMQTPEAGDQHHHVGDPVSQFLRLCTSCPYITTTWSNFPGQHMYFWVMPCQRGVAGCWQANVPHFYSVVQTLRQ